MKTLKTQILAVLSALLISCGTMAQESIATDEYVLIDLVVLNEGYGQKDRDAYSKETQKIAKKYGLQKKQSYQVAQKLAGTGPESATEFNLWTMPTPTAMAGLGQDSKYQANVPKRDKIHNMEALTLFLARPKPGFSDFTPKKGKFYLLDFVIMNENAGTMQRAIYNEKTRNIAKKHGIEMTASFDVLQSLGGPIPDVLEVNLWEMDSPESMKALGGDMEYQGNVAFRDQIHNMKDLTLYMAQVK